MWSNENTESHVWGSVFFTIALRQSISAVQVFGDARGHETLSM
jgi:hypothetical protein